MLYFILLYRYLNMFIVSKLGYVYLAAKPILLLFEFSDLVVSIARA